MADGRETPPAGAGASVGIPGRLRRRRVTRFGGHAVNRRHPRRRIAIGLALVAVAVLGCLLATRTAATRPANAAHGPTGSQTTPATEDDATRPALPPTVPSIQSWRSTLGRFRLGSRIVADPELTDYAHRLADDLASMTHTRPLSVTVGGTTAPGDIALRLGPVPTNHAEAYRVVVGSVLTAVAPTREGSLHATQTLLQWLRQSATLPDGVADDWPNYPMRGLLLDTGREFFPVPWLRARIRELAYLRMNYLHLHLSDTDGFRLGSDLHPEITSPQHYSKAEIESLVDYARDYGVEIIPEIDMPGHMGAILTHHPDLAWQPGKIDLTQQASYQLMADILREFLPLFPGAYWHIGADEYGNAADVAASASFRQYVNWAAGIVRAAGKTPVMWNDGLNYPGPLDIDPSIVIAYWARGNGLPWLGPGRTAAEDADAGHPIINDPYSPSYFTTGGPSAAFNAAPATLYGWDPGLFVDGSRLPAATADQLRGSELSIWCDVPTAMTPDRITAPLLARLPVMAQQLWGGTDQAAGYAGFLSRLAAVAVP